MPMSKLCCTWQPKTNSKAEHPLLPVAYVADYRPLGRYTTYRILNRILVSGHVGMARNPGSGLLLPECERLSYSEVTVGGLIITTIFGGSLLQV